MYYLGPSLGDLKPSALAGPLVWPILGVQNDTSKIIEIHCKKWGFGNMRLPNGAKMEPESAFFSVKKTYEFIVKNRVWAAKGPSRKYIKIKGLCFLSKKLIFHNPPFRLDRNPIFEVYGPICSSFSRYFWGHFFRPRFVDKT